MARKAAITAEALEGLGVPALAALVLTQAQADPAFARRVRLELAASAPGGKLHQEIDRRLAGLTRAGRFIERHEAGGVASELDAVRSAIAGRLALADPVAACERLQRFMALAEATMGRADDSDGAIGDVFGAALADLGRIWGERPDGQSAEMVAYVLRALEDDDYGVLRNVVAAFERALGETGRALLKQRLEAKLAKLPQPKADDWRLAGRRGIHVSALEELADAAGDVDAYIAASAAEPASDAKRHAIAERLLAAGRAEEALAWLAQCGEHCPDRLVDLRLQALDALGRKDEAQALRWSWFERTLSARHAKEFVRRLPDFDGFEAERRAVRTALDHTDDHAALRFLLELPDLPAVDQLVRRDIDRLDPNHYGLFDLAAQRLAERFPVAATLLWRRKVEDVLARGSSSQYGHAVRDLRQAGSVADRIEGEEIPAHQAWMERLRREHGRKWRFWELAGERR